MTIDERFELVKAQAREAGRPDGDTQVWDLLAATFTPEQRKVITAYLATETFANLCAVWRVFGGRNCELSRWALDCFRELGTWVLVDGVPALSSFCERWVIPQHPAPKPPRETELSCGHDFEDLITAPKTICGSEPVPACVAGARVCGECFWDWCLTPAFSQGVW